MTSQRIEALVAVIRKVSTHKRDGWSNNRPSLVIFTKNNLTIKNKKKNINSMKSIKRMIKVSRGHALVPRNLDMTLFGDKADKVAKIFGRMYRANMYKNDYGFVRERRKFTEPVTINTKYLVKVLHEAPSPRLDLSFRKT